MACIAKGGPGRAPKKFLDLFPNDEVDVTQEDFLECRCRKNGALLAFGMFKITADCNLPSGCILPKWNMKETFARPGELAFAETFTKQISGLSADEVLQPRTSRSLATAKWAIRLLQEALPDAENRRFLGDAMQALDQVELPQARDWSVTTYRFCYCFVPV